MSEQQTVFKNTFTYGVSSAITSLALFLLHLIAARYLGAEDFGRFSFAMAFVVLFVPLLDPGLYYLLIREVARQKNRAKHYLAHTLTWKILATPLVLLLIVGSVHWLNDSEATLQAVYLIAVSQILHAYKDGFRPVLLANEFFGLDAISLAIERFSLLLFSSAILMSGKGLLWLCWTFLIIRLVDLVIIALVVHYAVCQISVGRDLGFVKDLVLSAIPIGAFYITLSVYNYIDTVMLSVLRSDQEVGWYSASYKVYEGPVLIPAIIGTVFMPKLSRLFVENLNRFAALLERGLKYVVLASLLVSVNGILFSEMIINVTYGMEYANSITVLKILLLGLVFVFTINFLQTVMISIDRQKIILYISLLGLAVNVLMNAILIPLYGYLGASAATVLAEGMVCIILSWALHRIVLKVQWWSFWVKPICAGILAVILSQVLISGEAVFLQAGFMNISFLGLLYVFNCVDDEETQFIKNVICARKITGMDE